MPNVRDLPVTRAWPPQTASAYTACRPPSRPRSDRAVERSTAAAADRTGRRRRATTSPATTARPTARRSPTCSARRRRRKVQIDTGQRAGTERSERPGRLDGRADARARAAPTDGARGRRSTTPPRTRRSSPVSPACAPPRRRCRAPTSSRSPSTARSSRRRSPRPRSSENTQISGNFTPDTARSLANELNYGELPRQLPRREQPARLGHAGQRAAEGGLPRRRHRPDARRHLLADLLPRRSAW